MSALLVYSMYRATNHFRHNEKPGDPEEIFNALRQFAREGALNHNSSARVLDARWKPSSTQTKLPTPAEQRLASLKGVAKRLRKGSAEEQSRDSKRRAL